MRSRAITLSMVVGITIILLLTPMGISDEGDCGEETIDLLATRNLVDVGDIVVSHDGETLYVTITTTGDWTLEETHVHVAATYNGIPHTKKWNAIPGQFEYSKDHDHTTSTTYEIPFEWEDLECDDTVAIAVHAVVAKEIPCEVSIECTPPPVCWDTETAWGEGTDFDGKDWSMWFDYTAECCYSGKLPEIPEGDLEVKWTFHGPDSYWVAEIYLDDVEFDIPDDWDTDRTTWWAWCIDTDGTINSGAKLPGTFIHPDTTDPVEMCKWTRINYILNNRGDANWESVQAAIWHIWLETPWDEMHSSINLNEDELEDAQALNDAAECGWVADSGDWVAMIFIPDDPARQECIIEWDP